MLQNIPLSAKKTGIEQTRRRAKNQNTTLTAEFRRWLEQYVGAPQTVEDLSALMDRLGYAKTGRCKDLLTKHFTSALSCFSGPGSIYLGGRHF